MRTITITIVVLGFMLASHSLYAQDSQPETFYRDSIHRFICKYEH